MQGASATNRFPADYVMVEVIDTARHSKGDHRQDLRAVLHTKETRQGHRARALDRLRASSSRPTATSLSIQRSAGNQLPHSSCRAIAGRRRNRRGARHSMRKPPKQSRWPILPVTVPFCWSEDEEGLRSLNARGLTSRGYTVLEAGNGLEAIALIESHGGAVDLVVSDVVMPEMDGPTLAKELRTRNPNLKIIFVVGVTPRTRSRKISRRRHVHFCRSRSRSSSSSPL